MQGGHGGRDEGPSAAVDDDVAPAAGPSWSDRLTVEVRDGVVVHVDGQGRAWPSALDALWTGRLRMPGDPHAGGQTDALRLAMEDVAAGRDAGAGGFGRGLAAIVAWLAFEGLVRDGSSGTTLTEEGAAVLRQLLAPSAVRRRRGSLPS